MLTLNDFRHPTAEQFIGGMHADGYDHAVDPGILRLIGVALPACLILALRPTFTLGAPRSAWRQGVAMWHLGYGVGRCDRAGLRVRVIDAQCEPQNVRVTGRSR